MATAARSMRCSVSRSDSRRPRRARPVGACVSLVIARPASPSWDLRLYVSSLVSHILPPNGTKDSRGPRPRPAAHTGRTHEELAFLRRRPAGHVRGRPGERDRPPVLAVLGGGVRARAAARALGDARGDRAPLRPDLPLPARHGRLAGPLVPGPD